MPGLNVIISARGTEKTSLIDLIRYCLGGRNYTIVASMQSLDHAISVLAKLGSGQVNISLQDDSGPLVVTRAEGEAEAAPPPPFQPPMIFSQTEIENIGLEAAGRLRLIDSFHKADQGLYKSEGAAVGEARSQTSELLTLQKDRAGVGEPDRGHYRSRQATRRPQAGAR